MKIVVSRHPAAVEFIAQTLGATMVNRPGEQLPSELRLDEEVIPVISLATPDNVRGRYVYGNLPLHLAVLATMVSVIEFEGTPPRGQEYTLADMIQAGAVLRDYYVKRGV